MTPDAPARKIRIRKSSYTGRGLMDLVIPNPEEQEIVALVARWIDDEVRPVVNELEHTNTYPSKLILRFGTEEQRQRYLPSLATGALRATMALTEPDGGSDLQALRTVAKRVADGYVINGSKTWI